MFEKILIANRGEIACRVARAARALGVKTVAVYSDADANGLHVQACDESVRIGPPPARESYLDGQKVIAAAKQTGAQAIHPGYGFLSEQAEFAQACSDADIVFVGPPPSAMRAIKDKSQARTVMRAAGVPVVPGSEGHVGEELGAKAAAASLGYPLLVKAAAGGGGIGMQVARDEPELLKALRACADRAKASFGKGAVYLERYFEQPRHVEVQILGDGHLTLAVGARECSIQRRHQKVIEEAPPAAFELPQPRPRLLQRLLDAGLRAARAVGYANAGTCEFLLVGEEVYFIELNARLQVEHPVTEATTGLDLVQLQLRIAAGEKLPIGQDDVRPRGHAIECRINAEDPVKFFPSPGPVKRFDTPVPADGAFHDGVRIDAGYRAGDTVTPYYDSLLAKIIAFGETRAQATARLRSALERFSVEGVKTNIPTHLKALASDSFARGELDTHFLERL
ncbi:MAG TPA: biotin carboxylase N-terminal domain-containing protein [Myxococcales bacterium]|nr:biotin carboxylase N-terminal domain-containing protein [Myxococcales bacterium]